MATPKYEIFLIKTIDSIVNDRASERNLYSYIRDLLISPYTGLGWKGDNIVIDSSVGSGIPDIIIFPNGLDGTPNKASFNAAVIFDGKPGNVLESRQEALFEEKRKYIQLSTRWLILFDQISIIFYGIGNGDWKEIYKYTWKSLKNPDSFSEVFSRISATVFDLSAELEKFRQGSTRFAWQDVCWLGNAKFISLMKEISKLLQDKTQRLVQIRGKEELRQVQEEVDLMAPLYGQPEYVPKSGWVDVDFPERHVLCRGKAPNEQIEYFSGYHRSKERLHIVVAPYQWVLKVDKILLRDYAHKFGLPHTVTGHAIVYQKWS